MRRRVPTPELGARSAHLAWRRLVQRRCSRAVSGRPASPHSAARRSAKASQPCGSCCSPARVRGEAVRASISRSPSTTMYGTFCSCAARILFCIRFDESSTSTRRPRARRSVGQLLGRLDVPVGDRDDDRLDGRQPEREGAGEVLDEDADEPLERAVDGAVDGDRPLRLPVPRRCRSGRTARAASPGRPGWSPSATRGRARRRCRCRSSGRRTCRPWA